MTKVLFKPQSSNNTVTTKRQCVPSIVSGRHQHDFRCLTAHYQHPTFFSESKALCVDSHSVFEFSVPYRYSYIFTALLTSHQKKVIKKNSSNQWEYYLQIHNPPQQKKSTRKEEEWRKIRKTVSLALSLSFTPDWSHCLYKRKSGVNEVSKLTYVV